MYIETEIMLEYGWTSFVIMEVHPIKMLLINSNEITMLYFSLTFHGTFLEPHHQEYGTFMTL